MSPPQLMDAFFKNHQKCVLNSVWYCKISFKFSLEIVNPFAWNGFANFGHGGHVCAQFCSRERYIIPFHAYKGKEILFSSTEILQKEVLKKSLALAQEKFPNFYDKTKLPIQYILILVVGYGFLNLEISVLVDGMWGSVVTLRVDMTES